MEENKKSKKIKIERYIYLFLVSAAMVLAARFFYSIVDSVLIRLFCLSVFGNIIVIFSIESNAYYTNIQKDNGDNSKVFYFSYILFLILSFFLPLLPVGAWPLTVFFVLLTIISNLPSGILASSICMVIAFTLEPEAPFSYFVLYFITGIIASVLFSQLDSEFKIAFPLAITEIVLLGGLGIVTITSANPLSVEEHIYSLANGIVTLLLVLFILKLYLTKIYLVKKDRYLELNDPECKLLSELKKCSPDDYYKTVHVVYFCDRLSRRLGLDDDLIKCAGLYHRVGAIGGEINWENTSMIITEQQLPGEVVEIIRQYMDKSVQLKSVEAAVLYMSECIVSSVMYLFKKNKDINLDYPALVGMIFKQRIETGIFDNCDISIYQFNMMKKVFVEEKLYYDFLR